MARWHLRPFSSYAAQGLNAVNEHLMHELSRLRHLRMFLNEATIGANDYSANDITKASKSRNPKT